MARRLLPLTIARWAISHAWCPKALTRRTLPSSSRTSLTTTASPDPCANSPSFSSTRTTTTRSGPGRTPRASNRPRPSSTRAPLPPRRASSPQSDILSCVNATNARKRIAVVPGDGIGKEVIPQALEVLKATGAPLDFTILDWGADRYLADGTTVPPDGFAALSHDFDAIFVGALGDPRVATNIHAKEILLGMRFKMDLFANVRPVKLLDESLCPLKNSKPADIDFVVIRENTEGVYMDMGGYFKRDTPDEVATQEDINTRKGVERVIRYAFDYARQHGRKKVLMSDKSNVMSYAGGLWQRVFKLVAKEYPEIQVQHMYVDALCFQMVRDPKSLDVIVTNNMFGDIITDLAAALQGGLGIAPSGNIHPGRTSMFEPVHGSAPPIAGKNMANPIGAILSGAMMLEYLGFKTESAKIETAVLEAVRQKMTTADVGGSLGTKECAAWIREQLAQG